MYLLHALLHVLLILRTIAVFLLFLFAGLSAHTLLFVFLTLGIRVIGIYKIFNRLSKVYSTVEESSPTAVHLTLSFHGSISR